MIFTTRTSENLVSGTEYFSPTGFATTESVQDDAEMIVASACDLSDLQVRLVTAPGNGRSRSFDILVNGSSAAFSCTIANLNTTCGDSVASTPAVAAGDSIVVVASSTGTGPTPSAALVSFLCNN
jgi:hypothetical protein